MKKKKNLSNSNTVLFILITIFLSGIANSNVNLNKDSKINDNYSNKENKEKLKDKKLESKANLNNNFHLENKEKNIVVCDLKNCVNGICFQNMCFCKFEFFGETCEKSINDVDLNPVFLVICAITVIISWLLGYYIAKFLFFKCKSSNNGNAYSSNSNNSTEIIESENFVLLTKEK